MITKNTDYDAATLDKLMADASELRLARDAYTCEWMQADKAHIDEADDILGLGRPEQSLTPNTSGCHAKILLRILGRFNDGLQIMRQGIHELPGAYSMRRP